MIPILDSTYSMNQDLQATLAAVIPAISDWGHCVLRSECETYFTANIHFVIGFIVSGTQKVM